MWGYTTAIVAPTATAASTAVPPRCSASRPARVASGWGEATTPRRPRAAGQRVSGIGPDRVLALSGHGDAVRLELAPEVHAADAERLRRLRDVPGVTAELAQDVRTLERVARLADALEPRLRRHSDCLPRPERRRELLARDDVPGRHDDEPLDHVPELADVARPVVHHEVPHRLARERLRPLPVLRRERLQEVLHEDG